eukprot:TRINITY_DN26737_c0_g3_i1.p1 TRINITY_DN26737_c0_g3~~TRINITY_DN26737_c0_g3_i1.p1  ORF type:complete len:1730 (+),score=510.19 TRINITY_DN26737_c0_g3_i1:209-5398(+)
MKSRLPVRASSPAHASPMTGAGSLASRVRSASPSRRTLAIDMRHIASLLRDPHPVQGSISAAPGEASASPSVCSSPHAAWEQGDSGAAPMRLNRSPAAGPRMAGLHHQFSAVAEKVNVVISSLQRQCEADRRRIAGLERKVEARLEESARDGENRERWAEVQGSVSGLIEETQGLTRRVESLDERLWARTSGSELAKQKSRELEQQVQALEQQARITSASVEETQKRQAAKLRRAEHTIEDLIKRLTKVEEERSRPLPPPVDGYLQSRVGTLEQHVQELVGETRSLQMQLDEVQHLYDGARAREDEAADGDSGFGDALHSLERGHASLEKKVLGHVEDLQSSLATLRVKVDGHCSRVGTLAERLETAHVPALESLRSELLQNHSQHRNEIDGEIMSLKGRTREHHEGHEESIAELREELRTARAELAAAALHRNEEHQHSNPALMTLADRLNGHDQEIDEIRSYLDQLPHSGVPPLPQHGGEGEGQDGEGGEGGEYHDGHVSAEAVEDLQRRIEWLEEQSAAVSAAPEQQDAGQQRQLAQVQNSVCDMREQLSRLSHRVSSGETSTSAIQQQVQQLQGMIDRHHSDSGPSRNSAEVEAKVGAVSQQVADISARLLEVEGSLDFAREFPQAGSNVGSGIPTPAGGHVPQLHGTPQQPQQQSAGVLELHDKLNQVAGQLELVDELADRVDELEKRQAKAAGHPSPGPPSEISFGGDGLGKAASIASLGGVKELDEVRDRLGGLEDQIGNLQKGLTKQEKLGHELEKGFKAEIGSLKGIVDKVSALDERTLSLEEAAATKDSPKKSPRGGFTWDTAVGQLRDEMGDMRKELKTLEGNLATTSAAAKEDKRLFTELQNRMDDFAKNGAHASKTAAHDGDLAKEVAAAAASSREAKAKAEAAAEAAAKVSELHSRLGSVEDRLPKMEKELGALPEHRNNLEAIAKKIEAAKVLDKHGSLDERLGRLEGDSEERKGHGAELKSLAGKLSALETDAAELKKVREKHTSELGDHGKHVAELKRELAELRAQGAGSAGGKAATTAGTEAMPEAVERRLKDLEDLVSTRASEEEDARGEVQNKVKELAAQVTKDLGDLAEHQKELGSMRASLDALAKKANSDDLKSEVDGIRSRLTALEAKGSTASPQASAAAPATEALRKDLAQTKADVDDFKKELGAVQQRLKAAEESTASVKADVEQLQPRKVGISPGNASGSVAGGPSLAALSERVEELTEQVEDLQARGQGRPRPRRDSEDHTKDGSLNFSLTGMEQTKDGSLNFSLTGQTDDFGGSRAGGASRGVAAGEAPDDSLNFSLTKGESPTGSMSLDRPSVGLGGGASSAGSRAAASAVKSSPSKAGHAGGGFDDEVHAVSSDDEGSSNASGSLPLEDGSAKKGMEATSKDPLSGKNSALGGDKTKGGTPQLSRLGNLPSLGAKRGGDAGGDVLDSLMGGGGASKASSEEGKSGGVLGNRPRPAPLAGIGAGADESHGTGGGRGLASVAEEESVSDAGEVSVDSTGAKAGLRAGAIGSKVAVASTPSVASPAASSAASPHNPLDASVASQSNPLDVSISCNEISMGPDISVEDSLELEKCDHVEVVQPSSPAPKVATAVAKASAVSAGVTGALGSSLQAVRTTPAKAAAPAASSVVATGAVAAASTVVTGVAPKAAAKATAVATTVGVTGAPAAKAAAKATASPPKGPADADEEYGHESFEDDISVAESIEESLDGSGSDAWGGNNSS